MIGMGFQVRTRFVEGVIELEIEMVRLKVHDHEDRGNSARELAEPVEDVLGLDGHAFPEFLVMRLSRMSV
jgi:hypothetical protein